MTIARAARFISANPDNWNQPLSSEHGGRFGSILKRSLSYGPDHTGPTTVRKDAHAKIWNDHVKLVAPEKKTRLDAHMAKCVDFVKKKDARQARRDGKGWTEAQWRTDSFGVNDGTFLAGQLEFVYEGVLREPMPELHGLEMFFTDTSVPPGSQTHKVTRLSEQGEAKTHRGGGEGIPRVGISQKEEDFPVRHIVSSFSVDIFEMMAAGVARNLGFNLVAELLRVARKAIMSLLNRKIWYGDSINGLYGVLDYPWIMKKPLASSFVRGVTDGEDMLDELHALTEAPGDKSNDVLSPNRMVTSMRVKNVIMKTPLHAGSSDTTVGQHFLSTNSEINEIEAVWECKGVGPGGMDVILVYNDDRDGVAVVMVQAFQSLPVQIRDFEQITYCYASYGGVIMRNVGSNVIGYVVAEA